MTDQELIIEIDKMSLTQAISLVNEVVEIEEDDLSGGVGIPEEVYLTVKSALEQRTAAQIDGISKGLGTNIIRPTHNSGKDPNG